MMSDEYIEYLRELLQRSPKDYGYPFKTWTVSWLSKQIGKKMGIEISVPHLKRVMRDLGLSTRSKTQQVRYSQAGVNIFIADLPHLPDRQESEGSEPNLFQVKLDSKIYGAASSFSTYFSSATRRDLSCFTDITRVSILS